MPKLWQENLKAPNNYHLYPLNLRKNNEEDSDFSSVNFSGQNFADRMEILNGIPVRKIVGFVYYAS